ncbi:hypothetical protein Tco_0813471 [Tanacetum coccineum]
MVKSNKWEVDAPPYIIDVPGEDNDISDDEDPLPHDLADSDVEDLINDDDGVEGKIILMKRKAKAQFGRRESRQEDPGKDPKKPRLRIAVACNKGRAHRDRVRRRTDNTVVLPATIDLSVGNYFGEMIRKY